MPSFSYSMLVLLVCVWFSFVLCYSEPAKTIQLFENSIAQSSNPSALFSRSVPDDNCDNGKPCADASCCNIVTKKCGRDPSHCAANVCISNCDAKAECGIGAADPSLPCPLNVCCSQFGNCGTGDDFCGTGCQNNCGQPSAVNAGVGNVQKLVIGYWEGWSLNSRSCSARTINDVPVDSLTHLNLAFAYITSDFNIMPMPGTGNDVFSQITSLKTKAPGLKIWISIGGWTFNDNGTSTQPLFGEIASSAVNRGTFTTNLYNFMKQWGFDGVDLDWEYPGAGDRGGSPIDTPNYTLLLETMYAYFAASNSGYGISFTAPTSYWYLQHFDIGQMYQYVNWVNLMTYDL